MDIPQQDYDIVHPLRRIEPQSHTQNIHQATSQRQRKREREGEEEWMMINFSILSVID